MGRLTITLSDERQQALKETAARRNTTIGRLIEESLEAYGIKTGDEARDLVARARRDAGLSETGAVDLAIAEVREERGG